MRRSWWWGKAIRWRKRLGDKQVKGDGVLSRLIGKWLNAGVMDLGNISYPDRGSPQGGCISPILANVYLHYVMDEWFYREVLPRMHARAHLVRYADDAVMIFEVESDARRVLAVLGKRCSKYGLTIHPGKTRLVDFPLPPLRVVHSIVRHREANV